jgi:beta-galactosidase
VTWFGAGPHETYPDRRLARIGRYSSTVRDLAVPYIWPQENGGRAEVRWLEVLDEEGRGFRILLDRPRQASVLPYRAEDLAAADHQEDLVPRTSAIIHLDAAHRGVGTASCGPDTLPGYLVGPGSHRWSWTLEPIGPEAPGTAARRSRTGASPTVSPRPATPRGSRARATQQAPASRTRAKPKAPAGPRS